MNANGQKTLRTEIERVEDEAVAALIDLETALKARLMECRTVGKGIRKAAKAARSRVKNGVRPKEILKLQRVADTLSSAAGELEGTMSIERDLETAIEVLEVLK